MVHVCCFYGDCFCNSVFTRDINHVKWIFKLFLDTVVRVFLFLAFRYFILIFYNWVSMGILSITSWIHIFQYILLLRIFSVKLDQKGDTIENKIQKDDLKYVINQKWIIGIITVLVLVFIKYNMVFCNK